MLIETTQQEIVIRLPKIFDVEMLTKKLDYFRAMEIVAKSKGTQEEADVLAEELNTGIWEKNKSKYL